MTERERMPSIFLGHGNPMNALAQNKFTESWTMLGKNIPRPKGVLCISAHWYAPYTAVTATASPRTIHDFGGFPQALFDVRYPAPGDPHLAQRVQKLLEPVPVGLDHKWGLDHGTWSVFRHIFPAADVPIVQLSIDETRPAEFHYELGKRLAPLRDEGILIAGSGNVVHNLHAAAWGKEAVGPYDWGVRFEQLVRECILKGDHAPLIRYEAQGRDGRLSAPTPDHYLPLLYVLGTQSGEDATAFPAEGFDMGSISMLSVRIG